MTLCTNVFLIPPVFRQSQEWQYGGGGGVDCNVKMSPPVVTLSAALSPAMSHLSKLLDSLCRAFIRVPVEGGVTGRLRQHIVIMLFY